MTQAIARRTYDPDTLERGLLQTVLAGGNCRLAHDRLAEQGIDIPETTLRTWRLERHADRYQQIAAEVAPKVEATIVQEAREVAVLAAEVEREALLVTREQLRNRTIKDASGAGRNASTMKGINLTHVLSLSGRPTHIVENRQASDVIRKLKASGALQAIDAEYTELPDEPHNTEATSTTPAVPLSSQSDGRNAREDAGSRTD